MEKTAILLVCTANICRSPTAQAVLQKMIDQHGYGKAVKVSSAGTHPVYPRSPPDTRSKEHAALRGYDLSNIRARTLGQQDFEQSDLLLVMDEHNLKQVQISCPTIHLHKIHKLAEFCSRPGVADIPDPYYGSSAAFELVLDLIEDACSNLVRHLMSRTGANSTYP